MTNINISEAEWVVMEVIWDKTPQSASQIIQQVLIVEEWTPKTIRTLLDRLVKKRAVKCDKSGKEYLFAASISKKQSIKAEGKSFITRVFKGDIVPLVSHFVENSSLSKKELAELKKIIALAENKNDN